MVMLHPGCHLELPEEVCWMVILHATWALETKHQLFVQHPALKVPLLKHGGLSASTEWYLLGQPAQAFSIDMSQ